MPRQSIGYQTVKKKRLNSEDNDVASSIKAHDRDPNKATDANTFILAKMENIKHKVPQTICKYNKKRTFAFNSNGVVSGT